MHKIGNSIMAKAYVLINCDLGSEEEVIAKLKTTEEVKEIHGVYGSYDLIVKVESSGTESLREIITLQIRKMEKIRSTLTLMTIESQE